MATDESIAAAVVAAAFAPQSRQQPWQQPQLHLQVPVSSQHSFPSPSPVSSIADAYPPWYQSPIEGAGLASTLSSLSVASSSTSPVAPTNLSPVTPPASHPAFSFGASHIGIRYDDGTFDTPGDRRQSEGSLPSDLGVPGGLPASAAASFDAHQGANNAMIARKRSHQDLAYDDVEMAYALAGAGPPGGPGSPNEGSASGGELDEAKGGDGSGAFAGANGQKSTMSNNFVAKLYQMIIHPKSAAYIQWTEHGTSFVVSNVGEFSRNILGSHFKHSNFSSFVRQLNMYGFHKINRTPRSQRQSPDSQVWEFSHTKFLRGRPDLLDEIKRKALDADLAQGGPRHRVELPGELHSQLVQIREDNARMTHALQLEQEKVLRLADFTRALHDVVTRTIPGALSMLPPFPDFLDAPSPSEHPSIYVTRFPPSHLLPFPPPPTLSAHSSPTAEDPPPFPLPQHHHQHHHARTHAPLARHSFAHLSASPQDGFVDDASAEQAHAKRPRLELDPATGRRLARARSESAPLGVPLGNAWVARGMPGTLPQVQGVQKRRTEGDVMPSIARSSTVGRGQTPAM